MRNKRRRVPIFKREEDTDPLSVVVNLFDVAMVFAVGLANTAAVMVGKEISKKDFHTAEVYGKKLVFDSFLSPS